MSKDILKIITNGEFSKIKNIKKPEEISVEFDESMMKGVPPGMVGFLLEDVWTVVLVINSVPGLREWVQNKVYDATFEFLRSAVKTGGVFRPKIALSVHCMQSGEKYSVKVEGTETDLHSVQIAIKKKFADGSEKKAEFNINQKRK